jgi:alpha-tubulin suppressor-like RCC1 family protein
LSASGDVLCWGRNFDGQLGDGSFTPSASPVLALAGATDVTARGSHSCALTTAGEVWCWGKNANAQLGQDPTTTVRSNTPMRVSLPAAAEVDAGSEHTCARLTTGRVECWGANNYSQVGLPMGFPVVMPNDVGLASVAEIEAGFLHTCARLDTGEVRCWGDNRSGQVAVMMGSPIDVPVAVTLSGPAEEIATGDAFSCARLTTQRECWGANLQGQLGDGSTATSAHVTVMLP